VSTSYVTDPEVYLHENSASPFHKPWYIRQKTPSRKLIIKTSPFMSFGTAKLCVKTDVFEKFITYLMHFVDVNCNITSGPIIGGRSVSTNV